MAVYRKKVPRLKSGGMPDQWWGTGDIKEDPAWDWAAGEKSVECRVLEAKWKKYFEEFFFLTLWVLRLWTGSIWGFGEISDFKQGQSMWGFCEIHFTKIFVSPKNIQNNLWDFTHLLALLPLTWPELLWNGESGDLITHANSTFPYHCDSEQIMFYLSMKWS